MIVRVVRLTFKEEKLEEFEAFFQLHREAILSQPGCFFLEGFTDPSDSRIMYTMSHWKDEISLENYRDSIFFESIWAKVRLWFDGKPQAWSLKKKDDDETL